MKYLSFLICISCFALLTQSCTRIIYTPNMHNVPLLQEKNEVRATATLGLINYQSAYAVTDHFGIMMNGQFINGGGEDLSFNIFEEHATTSLVEGGLGYFNSIGEEGVFEIYAGGGKGKVSFEHNVTGQGRYAAKTSRYFVQTNLGMSKNSFEFAFSIRLLGLNFYNADLSQYDFHGAPFIQQDDVDLRKIDKQGHSFIEPAFTLRYGKKRIKFQIQLAFSGKLSSAPLNHDGSKLFAGVQVNMAKRYKDL